MFKYTFTREDTPVGRTVQVLRNGKHVAQLNLADRVHRNFSITKLTTWLGNRDMTRLVAFGEVVTVERETEIIF